MDTTLTAASVRCPICGKWARLESMPGFEPNRRYWHIEVKNLQTGEPTGQGDWCEVPPAAPTLESSAARMLESYVSYAQRYHEQSADHHGGFEICDRYYCHKARSIRQDMEFALSARAAAERAALDAALEQADELNFNQACYDQMVADESLPPSQTR